MPANSTLRFKSGKGKSVRIDKRRSEERLVTQKKVSKAKRFLALVILVLFSSLFLLGTTVYNKLNRSFVSADSPTSYDPSTDSYPSFLYLVVEDFKVSPAKLLELDFVVLDKVSKKTLVYEIPLDISIEVPGKFSESPVSKIFALGGLNSEDKLQGGVGLLERSILRLFGFKVDYYMLVDSSFSNQFSALVHKGSPVLSLSPATLDHFKNSFKTNFSLNNFYSTHTFLTSLPEDRFIKKTLSSNMSTIDEELYELTYASGISQEKKSISVMNGTNLSGVALFGSRVVKNMGGRIVAISTTRSPYDNSVLIVDDPVSETTKFLTYIFGIKTVYVKGSAEAAAFKESEIDRSDVTLILGFDIGSQVY